MITEDYVSFEVAKLLKEKGFDEKCVGYYPRGENTEINHSFLYERNSDWIDNSISAPTQQVVMKWLRVNYWLNTYCLYDKWSNKWECVITNMDNREIIKGNTSIKIDGFISYEEAIEAALKYCLTNLI